MSPLAAILLYVAAVTLGYLPGRIADRKGYELNDWWLFGTLAFVIALPAALLLTPRRSAARSPQGTRAA